MTRFLLAALPLFVLGCAAPPLAPDALALPRSANPEVATAPVATPDFLGGYAHRDPVEPRPWRELNREQAPQGER